MFSGIPYGLFMDCDNIRISVDSLRLSFSYTHRDYLHDEKRVVDTLDSIAASLDKLWFDHLEIQWTSRDKFIIGGYTRVCTISGVGFSLSVLLGRYDYKESKLVVPEAVIDCNPNKVPQEVLHKVCMTLRPRAIACTLKRFDLAFDLPFPRQEIFLVEDSSRCYQKLRDGHAVTEYQGKRHSHGSLKLYDKTAEFKLNHPVTRCEITVDATKLHTLPKLFPRLLRFGSEQLDMEFSSLPFYVQACFLHPDLIDIFRKSVDRKTFRKHMDLLQSLSQSSLMPSDWTSVLNFIDFALHEYAGEVFI